MAGHGAATGDLGDLGDLGPLSPAQLQALQQLTEMTSQDAREAIPLLQRSGWNVQIAITRFFDGEGPDPVAEAAADAAHAPRPIAARHENLQESLAAADNLPAWTDRRAAAQTDAAPRIVPRPATVWQPPFLVALCIMPFQVGYRAAWGLLRLFWYPLSLLPLPARFRGAALSMPRGWSSSAGRRMLLPRDTAQRFRREFEEEYGAHALPFFDDGVAQALDVAKRDLKFLLIVLVSPEHDHTDSFVRDTLLSPELAAFLNDGTNNVLLWGGNVLDSEAYQVATEYACTKFPFSCLVCLTPQEGGPTTRMGVIARLTGPILPAAYVAGLQRAMVRYGPALEKERGLRAAHEVARNLRSEQDAAYERSLARDRIRAQQRRAEAAAKEAAEREEQAKRTVVGRQEELRREWLRWRASTLAPTPDARAEDAVRVAIHLPADAGRVVRMFPAEANLEELYAVVECELLGHAKAAGGAETPVKPEGYEHKFGFRLTTLLPREVLKPSETVMIRDKMNRGGTLFVETPDSDDGEGYQ